MVPVDLYKGSGGKGHCPYLTLVDSGTTYIFISQTVVDKLGLEAVEAGRSRVKKKTLPPITLVDGEPLRATAVVWQIVQMRDSTRTKRSQAINLCRH
jgi:hypothetical protein